jgi:hypothetical protein
VTTASSCVPPLCKYLNFVMSASKVKKRQLEGEGRVFQEKMGKYDFF